MYFVPVDWLLELELLELLELELLELELLELEPDASWLSPVA